MEADTDTPQDAPAADQTDDSQSYSDEEETKDMQTAYREAMKKESKIDDDNPDGSTLPKSKGESTSDDKPVDDKKADDSSAKGKKDDSASAKDEEADKKKGEENKAKTDDSEDGDKKSDEDGDAKGKQKIDYSKPPKGMRKEAAADWEKLSPEGQKALTELQTKGEAALRQAGRREEALKPVSEALASVMKDHPQLAEAPLDKVGGYLAEMIAVDKAFQADPLRTILNLADDAKILPRLKEVMANADLDKLGVSGDSGQQGDADLRAIVEAQQKKIADLEKRDLTTEMRRANRKEELVTALDNFGKTAPHWDDVQDQVIDFVPVIAKDSAPGTSAEDIVATAYRTTMAMKGLDATGTTAPSDAVSKASAAAKANDLNVTSARSGSRADEDEDEDSIYKRVYRSHQS